jgi:hypothetical protein
MPLVCNLNNIFKYEADVEHFVISIGIYQIDIHVELMVVNR